MLNMISVLRRAAVALILVLGSGIALAGPTYHVTLNTAGLSGSGFLDFGVVGTPGSPSAMASISNLLGDFGAEYERRGLVGGDIPAGFTLTNGDGDNYLTQAITFGGLFAFDISFAGDYESVDGSDGATFAISLYDELFSQQTLAATFAAQPGSVLGGATLTAQAEINAVTINEVSEVPEPSELVLVLTALAVAGAAVRTRRSVASAPR